MTISVSAHFVTSVKAKFTKGGSTQYLDLTIVTKNGEMEFTFFPHSPEVSEKLKELEEAIHTIFLPRAKPDIDTPRFTLTEPDLPPSPMPRPRGPQDDDDEIPF